MWAGFNKAWRSVLLALPVWTWQWYARSLTLSAQSPASGGRTRPPFLSEVSAICFSCCHFWHQQPQNGDHLTWDQLIGIQIIFIVQHHLLDFRLDLQDRDPTSEDIFLWIVIDLKFTPRNEVNVCIYEGFVWRKFVKTAQFVLNLRAIKGKNNFGVKTLPCSRGWRLAVKEGGKMEGGLIRWSQEPPLLPVDCCNMWGFYWFIDCPRCSGGAATFLSTS